LKIKIEIQIDTENEKDVAKMNELYRLIENYDEQDEQDEGYEFDD
tara:strand:+ start:504 stop:638 length:135 start_codon:yes stop_codon:yes gene_type:complete